MTRSHVAAALCGVLFAVGLALSGMTQPAKVVGFLDFFGNWDPSLAFVMGGAILVYFPLYRLSIQRKTPLFAARFLIPTRRDIDARLIGGAALFGVGWGFGGYCPGPGITSLGAASLPAVIFVASMLLGMALYRALEIARSPRPAAESASPPR